MDGCGWMRTNADGCGWMRTDVDVATWLMSRARAVSAVEAVFRRSADSRSSADQLPGVEVKGRGEKEPSCEGLAWLLLQRLNQLR